MTIPSIAPYTLPTADELPTGKLSWRPDAARAVLLVHDMQDYFVSFYQRGRAPMPEVLHNIASLRALAEARQVPVVYSAQPADQERAQRGLLNDLWGPGLTAHPQREAIVDELRPRASDLVLCKTRYSAFHQTELLSFMREQGRDQLWICGVFAHIGCMITACDAFMNDLQPFMVADAVADFSREHHDMALQFVTGRCGATITTQALCARISGQPDALEAHVRAVLATLLQQEPSALRGDDDLREQGLDSVRLLELVESLHGAGLPVTMLDLMEVDTLAGLLCSLRGVAQRTGASLQLQASAP